MTDVAIVGKIKTNKREQTLKEYMLKHREKIISLCEGCKRVDKTDKCVAYMIPKQMWRLGDCPLATHIEKEVKKSKKYKPKKYGKKRQRA